MIIHLQRGRGQKRLTSMVVGPGAAVAEWRAAAPARSPADHLPGRCETALTTYKTPVSGHLTSYPVGTCGLTGPGGVLLGGVERAGRGVAAAGVRDDHHALLPALARAAPRLPPPLRCSLTLLPAPPLSPCSRTLRGDIPLTLRALPPACCRVLSSALAALLLWAKLLAYLRGFRETGALIRMICQIGSDMRYFLVVRTGMHTGCLPATSRHAHNCPGLGWTTKTCCLTEST